MVADTSLNSVRGEARLLGFSPVRPRTLGRVRTRYESLRANNATALCVLVGQSHPATLGSPLAQHQPQPAVRPGHPGY